MMHIQYESVPWWEGYQTLMVADPPRIPPRHEVESVLYWARKNEVTLYNPIPFRDFISLPPWRHFCHRRWKRCMDSLDWDIRDKAFIDIGGNAGYYAFLARAAGADYSVLLDIDPKVLNLARQVSALYSMSLITINSSFEDGISGSGQFHVGFCFSAMPYIGLEKTKSLLKKLSRRIDVLFIEMGDGGSVLEGYESLEAQRELFEETNWKPEYLGQEFASHTNTWRPLWKLETRDIVDHIYPFTPLSRSTSGRCYRDGNGMVFKLMRDGLPHLVRREYDYQMRAWQMIPGQIPEPLECGDQYILMKDLGDPTPVKNWNSVYDSAERLLLALHQAHIEHGDLDSSNVFIQDDIVKLLDFGHAKTVEFTDNRQWLMRTLEVIKNS